MLPQRSLASALHSTRLVRALLVDDDPAFRSLIVATAPSWLEVVACGSTREAVTTLTLPTSDSIDLALIDLQMEPHLGRSVETEGLALLAWMREHGFFMPVALVSAFGTAVVDGRALGVLRKPVDLARVYALLEAYRELWRD